MPETFDLIVRGGEVVNHAGRGMADVGIRGGRFAAIGDLGARGIAARLVRADGTIVHVGDWPGETPRFAAGKADRSDPIPRKVQ